MTFLQGILCPDDDDDQDDDDDDEEEEEEEQVADWGDVEDHKENKEEGDEDNSKQGTAGAGSLAAGIQLLPVPVVVQHTGRQQQLQAEAPCSSVLVDVQLQAHGLVLPQVGVRVQVGSAMSCTIG